MLYGSNLVARIARLNTRADELAHEARRLKVSPPNLLTPLELHIYLGALEDAAGKLWDARAVLGKALERIARDEAVRAAGVRLHDWEG